ncbi:long-chain-fatty-acid--CoA ligase [Deinococcus roseus]|uniref:Long-chain-fatty-acid--CoA ligase n=1 Tax=Deinococcus roseus TaxID=392414 RepID=A0ABQ2CYS2_9DEIO|nr:long-chain fatty acid--CoA ligase [Deinococcus roseus]GGJ34307.1 long-chain-fatty-acid--CoA ligase [Deinococcus roseus]
MTQKPWFAHYEKGVPHGVEIPSMLLHDLLIQSAQKYPKRVAVHFIGYTLTYEQLLEQARRFAHSLQSWGVKKGDRVAIMLPNCPQQLVAFFGASLAGAIVVNTSPLYVARELQHQLQDSGSETLVILNSFFPRYQEIEGQSPVKRVIVTTIADALPFPKNMIFPMLEKKKKSWVEVKPTEKVKKFPDLLKHHNHNVQPVDLKPEDVALLQYTGGTTGTPKGAMLTHRNLVANCIQAKSWLPDLQEGKEVSLGAIPYFHVYGMTASMNLSIAIGATIALIPNPRDIPMVLKTIDRMKPSIFPGVPTLYNAINNHPDTPKHDLTSIKACISGSAALPVETARTFQRITQGANLVEGYGLTETSPVTHVNPVYGEHREGSIGVPLPGVDARVADENGKELPPGEIGELIVSGPNIMLGYWERPIESQQVLKVLDGQTWLFTGDMATMDPDGYFRIVDRKKDVIITGGFNVYPREVEEVLYTHPDIQEAAVLGVPDPYRGEAVKAVVVLKMGKSISPEELKQYCRKELSPYKVPREIEFRTELPKTAVGKILRRALAESQEAPQNS